MGVRSDAKKLSKIWQLSKVHRDEMLRGVGYYCTLKAVIISAVYL